MKRWITILPVIVVMAVLLGTNAYAAYDPNVDYTVAMVDAAICGDYERGYAAQDARNEKIDNLGMAYNKIDFGDLMLLSKIIYAEAGSEWLSDDWKMCVGEVVLNRVESPEFPNTISEVIAQPGQYYGVNSGYFNSLLPSYRCARIAVRLLNGERLLEPSVVFQANFRQGSGTCQSYYDKYLGYTYFCYSNRMDLYSGKKV